MIPLKTEFKKYGYTLRQIKRVGAAALFEQSKNGVLHTYEVVRVLFHNGYTLGGRDFPPSEFYPSPEQWGAHGWTFLRREDAERKLLALAKCLDTVEIDLSDLQIELFEDDEEDAV